MQVIQKILFNKKKACEATIVRKNHKKNKIWSVVFLGCAVFGLVFLMPKVLINTNKDRVYANTSSDTPTSDTALQPTLAEQEESNLKLAGLIDGVKGVELYSNSRKELEVEQSFEEVLVGASIANREAMDKISLTQNIKLRTTGFSQSAEELIKENQMTDRDYNALLHIVEAEATGEGILGKMIVARVVLNRVDNPNFPNTIYDVVWEKNNGVPQFSPTTDGRISSLDITKDTREAVNRVINGEDYSQGALFFSARDQADQNAMVWFDGELTKLFTHGGHEFYTLSEDK